MDKAIMSSKETLIDLCESLFVCEHGARKAFFHIPVRNQEPIRGMYVSYTVKGPSIEDTTNWMTEHVVRPLARKAGEGAFLYWRLSSCFEIEAYEDTFILRTRIVVLDKDLNAVTLPDQIVTEGAMCKSTEPRVIQDYE